MPVLAAPAAGTGPGARSMTRILALTYGLVSYAIFFATFLYAIGFVGNLVVPKGIDAGPDVPGGRALPVDAALLALFAVQHSAMARPGFKRWWTRLVPAPVERSTYVLLSSLLLALLFWQWRPMLDVVWSVEATAGRAALHALFGLGWAVVLLSTFMIDHLDLFGVRQVVLYFKGKEYAPPAFRTTGFYRFVRHPLMVGFIVAFWATPRMTAGHLLFAVATTAYILVAIRIEEGDLLRVLGEDYRRYREKVPMLLPRPGRGT